MSTFDALLRNISLPEIYNVRQKFSNDFIRDIPAAIENTLEMSPLSERLPRNGEVAIGVGSRGIANLPEIVKATVGWFLAHKTRPFIIPAMGSHGGATAEGQLLVLEQLGITEDTVGCPVRATMETIELGRLSNELPICIDAEAAKADGIFVINRIKPHTGFTGIHESGLVKMITVGLGKQKGADACHSHGYANFAENMSKMADLILRKYPSLLGGLAIIENAYDKTCLLEAVPRESLVERDMTLLEYAKKRIGKIFTETLDVLLIGRMGKDISGAGIDPNIVGRAVSPYKAGELKCNKIGVLRLTEKSYGNATGVGIADVVTKRLFDNINFDYTYTNVITSTMLKAAFIPVVMSTDEATLRCLIKTCNAGERPVRMAFIRDTLSVEEIWVSRPVAEEMSSRPECHVDFSPRKILFDTNGSCCFPAWEK